MQFCAAFGANRHDTWVGCEKVADLLKTIALLREPVRQLPDAESCVE